LNDDQTTHERYTIHNPATGQILVTTAIDPTDARMRAETHWPDADAGSLIVRSEAEDAELDAEQ